MNNIRIMQVKDRFSNLVDNILFVLLLQMLITPIVTDESMQIYVHMLKDKVYIFVIMSSDDIIELNDIGVF